MNSPRLKLGNETFEYYLGTGAVVGHAHGLRRLGLQVHSNPSVPFQRSAAESSRYTSLLTSSTIGS